jgi:hypothetical protein
MTAPANPPPETLAMRMLRVRFTLRTLILAVGVAAFGIDIARRWWPRPTTVIICIEPPAVSGFADPYDLDNPPAPPNDAGITDALAPVPPSRNSASGEL